jgi:1,2-phenylacetyl-CoA epoxidase PaaB subunit
MKSEDILIYLTLVFWLTRELHVFQVLSNPEKRNIHDTAIRNKKNSIEMGNEGVSIWIVFNAQIRTVRSSLRSTRIPILS